MFSLTSAVLLGNLATSSRFDTTTAVMAVANLRETPLPEPLPLLFVTSFCIVSSTARAVVALPFASCELNVSLSAVTVAGSASAVSGSDVAVFVDSQNASADALPATLFSPATHVVTECGKHPPVSSAAAENMPLAQSVHTASSAVAEPTVNPFPAVHDDTELEVHAVLSLVSL